MISPHQPFFVDCPFREARNYVHSTSLCNALSDKFGHCDSFDLVLKGWMTNRVCFTPVDVVRAGHGTGHVAIRQEGRKQIWELSEDPGFPVSARDSYDEDALVDPADVADGKIASRASDTGTASFFDRLIAANKVLINTALTPGVKLIAAKVNLGGFPPRDVEFELELASHLGTRIFKTKVLVTKEILGELVFYGE